MSKLAVAAVLMAGTVLAAPTRMHGQDTGVSRPQAVPVTTSPDGVQQPVVYEDAAGEAATAPATAAPALRARRALVQGEMAEQGSTPQSATVRTATERKEVAALEHPAVAARREPSADERDDEALARMHEGSIVEAGAGASNGTGASSVARASDTPGYGSNEGHRAFLSAKAAPSDVDGQIVLRVPGSSHELPEGTLLKVRVQEAFTTTGSHPGQEFHAELQQPVERDGRILLPAGSVVQGRVTEVHGGRRISGAASLHLEPMRVTLPDGTEYLLRARVIDTDLYEDRKVDDEGTILRKDHVKSRLAVAGLTTAGAAAAGGVIAGPAGALIGAGIGAGVNTVMWLKADRQMELPAGTKMIFSLTRPLEMGGVSGQDARPE